MPLPSSGEISLGDIQTEFGGTNPIAIIEYYRGSGLVPNQSPNLNMPISGVIKLSDFYSTSLTESSTSLSLGYHISSNSLACSDFSSSPSTFYLDSSNITTAFIIATNTELTSFAPAGWYSDGNVARYWSGVLFQTYTVPCGTTNFYSNLTSEIIGNIYAITTQDASNNVIIGGQLQEVYGTPDHIKTLNFNGSDNTTFNTNLSSGFDEWFTDVTGGVATPLGFTSVNVIKIDANNKVLIGGEFKRFKGLFRNAMVRLNSDGTEDSNFYTSFLGNTGFNSTVGTVEIQNDGKILVGGRFTIVASYSVPFLCRLNANSVEQDLIDTTFNTNLGSGPNNRVQTIKLLSNGQILVGGLFTQFNGTSQNGIIKLNANGTVDTTFNIGTGFANSNGTMYVNEIEILDNGKIIVGGTFTSYNGTTVSNLVLLDSNGSLDTATTSAILPVNGNVSAMLKTTDGSIIVGGSFTSPNIDNNENGIKKFNPYLTGLSTDSEFQRNIGSGISGNSAYVTALDEKPNGNILVGGSFTTFNGRTRKNITELNANGAEYVTAEFDSNGGTPDFSDQEGLSPLYVTNPGSPTRPGFTFNGWRPILDNVIDFQRSVPNAINTSTTFTAIWNGSITISLEELGSSVIISVTDETGNTNIHEFVLEVSVAGGAYNVEESKLNSSLPYNTFQFEYNTLQSTNYSFKVKGKDNLGIVLAESNIASITTSALVLTSMNLVQNSTSNTPTLACQSGTILGNLFYYYAPTTTSRPTQGTVIYVDAGTQYPLPGNNKWMKFYKDNLYFALQIDNSGVTPGYDAEYNCPY